MKPPRDGYWPIPVMWPGATVVCIAGGPSLTLTQVRRVAIARLEERCRVIAVNDAIYVAWFADWLHATDNKWWTWHRLSATKFGGIKTAIADGLPAGWGVKILRNANGEGGQMGGFSEAPDTIHPGGNGGYQAVQMAAKAGGCRIPLLGFDMRFGPADESHWHGDHPDGMRSDYVNTMLPWWPSLVEPLKARGVEVINCSPGSAIECFPRANIEDVL